MSKQSRHSALKKILLFFVLALLSYSLYANGAAFMPGIDSGTVVPYNIKGVQLEREFIHIYKDKTVCKFILKNLNKKDVEFQMGFPFIYKLSADQSQNKKEIYDNEFERLKADFEKGINENIKKLNFIIKSGGEEQKVTIKINANLENRFSILANPLTNSPDQLKKKQKIVKENETPAQELYDYVALWDEKIKAGQEIEVDCEYDTVWDKTLSDFRDNRFYTMYVRATAAHWEDNILEANFYIHLDHLGDPEVVGTGRNTYTIQKLVEVKDNEMENLKPYMKISPDGYYINVKENRIEWHEYNVKLMEDIYFEYGIAKGADVTDVQLLDWLKIYLLDSDESAESAPGKGKKKSKNSKEPVRAYSTGAKKLMSSKMDDETVAQLHSFWPGETGWTSYEPWKQRIIYKVFRNYYYAKHGKPLQEKELNDFYKDIFKPEEIEPGELNEIEKNNVEKIRDYEKAFLYDFNDSGPETTVTPDAK